MRRRRFASAVTLLAALATLVGCGGQTEAHDTGVVDDTDGRGEDSGGLDTPTTQDTPVDPGDTPAVETETASPAPPPMPLDLSGVTFVEDPALTGCGVASFGGNRARAVLAATADLDGDGVDEVVLANAACQGVGGAVTHPVFGWDPVAEGLVLRDGLADRLDIPTTEVGALTFVDVDEDADADLVAAWPAPQQGPQTLLIAANDGSGRFDRLAWIAEGSATTTAGLYGFGLGWQEESGFTLWTANRAPDQAPSGAHRVGRLQRAATGWRLNTTWGEARDSVAGAWAWIPMSRDPNLSPFEHMFVAVNHVPGPDDYHLSLTDGTWEPPTFVHRETDASGRPINALHFASPTCTDDTPVCFTPMGGTMVRFDDGGGAHRDCLLIAAGGGSPVYVQCPDPAGGWREDGLLGSAFAVVLPNGPGGTPPPPRSSWQVLGTWDLNADGWMDVTVTTGRDFDLRPASPSYAFLQTPGCAGAGCARYAMSELPWPEGHVLGVATAVVPRASGGWAVIAVPSLNTVYDDGLDTPRALRWTLASDRRWLAVRVGDGHDLRGVGSVVRPRFRDETGALLPSTTEILLMPAPSWGMPGGNAPVIVGVPSEAVSASVEVDLPGCRPTVQAAVTAFDAPVDVAIAACP